MIYFPEPRGQKRTQFSNIGGSTTRYKLNELTYATFRRFIVVNQDAGHSLGM